MEAKDSEFKSLAVECLKAFTEAALETSDLPQVQKAITMCKLYAPCSASTTQSVKHTSIIANLWKNDKPGAPSETLEDTQARAATVLGEKLVATVVQENRQPPDVYAIEYCVGSFPAF